MQWKYGVLVALLAASLGMVSSALAQQDPDRGVPVEFYACEWEDGKDMADLDRVLKKFNQWADKRTTGYSAWLLIPQFHDDVDFDIGWLGSWPDGNAFGQLSDAWTNEGGDVAAAFAEVVDCSERHQLATSVQVNAPDGPPGDGLVMFSQCTLLDGVSPAEALPAHRKVAETMRGMGSKAMSWLFYPALGVSDETIDYWSVVAFNNYPEMGAAMELWVNGGGWAKAAPIVSKVSRCSSASLFEARLVRAGLQQ